LVVDDEESVARVAARCLQHFGYSTAMVHGGGAALETIAGAAAPIDAVLLDRTMPGMSGEETLAALRERHPRVAVVLTSGFDEGESALATRAARADVFLRKPYTPDELARAIRAALEQAQARSRAPGDASSAPLS
jgi:CheY-like chemotaxis protein